MDMLLLDKSEKYVNYMNDAQMFRSQKIEAMPNFEKCGTICHTWLRAFESFSNKTRRLVLAYNYIELLLLNRLLRSIIHASYVCSYYEHAHNFKNIYGHAHSCLF